MPKALTEAADAVESLEPAAPLDGRRSGVRVHTAVAHFLERGIRRPSPLEVVSLARDIVLEPGVAMVYRQSAIQRLSTATASYFRFFALDESWVFAGSEVKVGRCRLDLVFEREDGAVIVDELKAGRAAHVAERRLADEQIAQQLEAGAAKWGDAFVGVRAIFLVAPRASFMATPDGQRASLEWGGV